MNPTDQFIENCLRLCERHMGRDIDYKTVGQSIYEASKTLPSHVHPMIREIASNAQELAEDLIYMEDEESKRRNFDDIYRFAKDYSGSRWHPTIWIMIAVYTLEGKNESASVRVSCQKGNVQVETASDTLRSMIAGLQINDDQTDEWYVNNLSRLLPKKVADLELMDIQLNEQLKPEQPSWQSMPLTRETVERYAKAYDKRFEGKSDSLGEEELSWWFSTHRYLDRAHFMKLGMWKSPRPKKHYEKNSEASIIQVTSDALASNDESYRILRLQELHGVKWPVASVILYYAFPNEYSILDFRALWSLGIDRKSYNLSFWSDYTARIRRISSDLQVSIRTLDKALWEYSKQEQPR